MSESVEAATFISDNQRQRVIRSAIEAYYADWPKTAIVFDTNRAWCACLPCLAQLFPEARVICCVRSIAWILDSFERQCQQHPFVAPAMFGCNPALNVYARVEGLLGNGPVGFGLNCLRQAWFGEYADRLLCIRYESLTTQPREAVNRLYQLLGQEPFRHDFEHLEYDEPEYDRRLGIAGLHTVRPRVEPNARRTILPSDIARKFERDFWDQPENNPRNVKIL